MCGRFALPPDAIIRLEEDTGARWRGAPPAPAYNVCPMDLAPVLRLDGGERVLEVYRWGLIPGWAKDAAIGAKCFNARGETAHEKPSFRSAFKRRRCLVPVPGFYEWQKIDGQARQQPWWIHSADGGTMTFAGLWEEWRPQPEVEPVRTFTIVTTEPNGFMGRLHQRMPVILDDGGRDAWLDPDAPIDALLELVRPSRDDYLAGYHVSTRVNIPSADGPELLEPIGA
jgi:putative SOS response-associated peptidase YedK